MYILLSVADPPLTNRPSLSPTCWVPGKDLKALVTSPFALGVVTISIADKTAPLFLSLATNDPAEITTAFNSVTSSFKVIFNMIGADAMLSSCSKVR